MDFANMEPVKKKTKFAVPDGVREADQVGHPAVILHFRPSHADATPKTLEYFAVPGVAECIKLTLEATGTPYDAILHFDAIAWKARAPFGQLPIYRGEELGEITLCESRAICNHIARLTGLGGSGTAQQAQVNQLFELAEDIDGKKFGLFDPKHSDAPRLKMFLSAAESCAPEIGSQHFIGDMLTLADVAIFRILYKFSELLPNCLAPYTKLSAFVENFAKRTAIAAYLKSERRLQHCYNEVGDRPYESTAAGFKYTKPLNPQVCAEIWSSE